MSEFKNTPEELLNLAKEFVEYMAGLEMSGENIISPDVIMPPAMELRRRADAIEKRDEKICRARKLLKDIKDAGI